MPIFADVSPDTIVSISDGNTVRIITAEELHNELEMYKKDVTISHGAYEREDGVFVIPMKPEVKAQLEEQLKDENEDFEELDSRGSIGKNYYKSWGNAEYFAAYIDAGLTLNGNASTRSLDAHFYAGGTVFNRDVRVLSLDANLRNNSSSPYAAASVKIFNQTVWSQSQNLYYERDWSKSWKVTQRFMVGPVPVSVTASIGGSIGFKIALGLTASDFGIEGKLIPRLSVRGTAEACVDAVVAKAGVRGSLTFLNTTFTFTPSAKPKQLSLNIDAKVTALSGSIKVIAEILGEGVWELELFSWAGYINSWNLYNKTLYL